FLILRLVVGLTLAAHGAQKLSSLSQTAAAFEQLGFMPGRRSALLAGLAETAAGLFLALGLFTPVAAAIAVAVMVVAAVSAHVQQGFFAHKGGYEYTLILGIAALSLAFTGPGPLSLDAALGVRDAGAGWGLGALVVGLAGAGVQLAQRRETKGASAPART